MGISHRVTYCGITIDLDRICACTVRSGDHICRNFFDSICYEFAGFLFIQTGKLTGPSVAFIKDQRFPRLHTVRKKFNLYGFRSDAVLIILIHPDFFHIYICFARGVLVCDVVVVFSGTVLCSICFGFVLGHGVYYKFTVIPVLKKLIKAVTPSAVFVRFYLYRSSLFSVGMKPYGHFLRAYAVLIIFIIPCLGAAHTYPFRCVGVGHLITVLRTACYGDRISARAIRSGDHICRNLFNGIGDLLSGLLYIQICKCTAPSVALIQHHGLTGIHSIC